MSNTVTISLPAGYQLTITADEFASGYFYEIGGTGITAVSASSNTSVGPFAVAKNYGIVSETGTLQTSQAPAIATGGLTSLEDDTTPTLGGDLDLNGNNIDFPTTMDISDVIDDDTFATASDTTLATSESIKAYVDANIGAADMDWTDPVDAVITPDADSTRDIGTTLVRFKDLYVDSVVVTGNVDGRDVSVDGTKLDGIESGATADQNADEVPYDNATSGLTATDVQAAIDELDSTIDSIVSDTDVVNTRVVYVDKGGNDGTGDGSAEKPYLTISAAITAISDASSGNKYNVVINPGSYSETLTLKPYVNLMGTNPEVTLVSSASAISLSAAGRVEIADISIGGGGGLDIDSSGFASASVVTLRNTIVTGPASMSGRGPGSDYFQLRECYVTGNVSITGCASTILNSTLVGNLLLETGGTVVNGFGELSETTVAGGYVIDISALANGADTMFVQAYDFRNDGDLSLTGAGVTYEVDSTSYPIGTISTSGGPTLTRRTNSDAINANRTPTNYSASGSDLKSHLDGIDTALGAGSHAAVTLNADDTTQETLNLSVQELQVNLATTTTDGAMSGADKLKLDGIEALADVTDDANVKAALDGMVLTAVTVASTDKVLIQDVSDSDNLKTVTAQSIADLGAAASALDDLTDVTITTPATGDILSYNGSAWVNDAIESTTSASDDKVLVKDTSASDAYKYDTAANVTSAAIKSYSNAAVAATDKVIFRDTSASDAVVYDDALDVANLFDASTVTSTTSATGDQVLLRDVSNSNALRYDTITNILALGGGGGGKYALIATADLSTGSPTQAAFTSLSAGKQYVLEFNDVSGGNNNLIIEISSNGGSSYTTSGYEYIVNGSASNATTDLTVNSTSAASIVLNVSNVGGGSSTVGYVRFEIGNAGTWFVTNSSLSHRNSSGDWVSSTGTGALEGGSSWNAMRVRQSGGGGFSTGRISLYHIQHS